MTLREQFKEINKKFGKYIHHTDDEIMTLADGFNPNVEGCIVECGVYQGVGSAKLSLIAEKYDRKLYCFDSFEGIPENSEPHDKNIWGNPARFRKGDFSARLEEAKKNIAELGKIERCEFIEGWFDVTLPDFKEPIAAIYLDVDLAGSTMTCLDYLWPLLNKGGILVSQDAHLPLVIEVLKEFAVRNNLVIDGLGKKKLIKVIK